ncbi:mannosyltransferase [Nostoc sp. CENA67]|uniref:Mannosyltransferase n=1 Tax=Amazonocrinis nigriterrae CENA67 TaxID=2794033 RepID=A0A8J7HTV6_9NOST|nr:mannosyltransferase [Amazonocrinis nigriterrae]MBH8562434.1 mannosyltransferase [Amazonocrinis nigriterrae CENA67]
MNQKEIVKAIFLPLLICSTFILCTAIAMLIHPEAFHKFFSPTQILRENPPQLPHKSYYWDVEHYAKLALNPSCNAFYPLWPFIIRTLFHPQTIEQAAHYFSVVATTLFFISTFIVFWVFQTGLQRLDLVFWLVLVYSVNPMAIFRVIGYTESLFALLSTLFIWICLPKLKLNENFKLCLIFITTFLMALTRPVLLQILLSSIASLATIFYFQTLVQIGLFRNNLFTIITKYIYEIKTTLTICVSALSGYSIYGTFCLITRGDFFATFQDQKLWGKKLGLHLELLLFPKSPLFDLLGLYLPAMILFISLIFVYFKLTQHELQIFVPQSKLWNILLVYPPLLILFYLFNYLKFKKQKKLTKLIITKHTQALSENYIFWFSIYFCFIHCLIIFFTQDRLFSLARFIFAVPFFFISIGYIYLCIDNKKIYNTLFYFILISAIALFEQWANYSQDKWLG